MTKWEKEAMDGAMERIQRPVQVTMFIACPVCTNVTTRKVWAAVGESTRSYTSTRVCSGCR